MIRRASYNEPALTPLPYNTEISDNNTIFNPRSSFTKHLQRSSYLFPKRKSSSSDTDKKADKQQHYPRTMNRVTLDHHDDDSNKKMRYNDSDSNMRLKELYSVSAFEDTPTISQSPTDARGDMNMTKQDQHCNVKPPPLCSLTTDNNDKRHVTNMTKSIVNDNNSNSIRRKKSVSFHPQVSTKYTPSTSSMPISTSTSQNKTQLWYTSSEYDQFKYQAALDCGIKMMQSNNVSSSQKNDGKKRRKRGPQFIQIGDFDCKKNENINDNTIATTTASSYSSSSMDTMPTDNTKDEKFSRYYNENEYNDQVSSTAVEERSNSCTAAAHGRVIDLISNKPQQQQQEEPTVVCKRGLGYHFSRTRKRARMSTRSAVLAWQKNLRGASNTTSSRATANDKSIMMLALVSSKCSRVAREEAKWRGLVDYKIAYPERHQELLHQQPSVSSQQPFSYFANEKVQFDNDMNMNDKKRPHDDIAAPIIHFDFITRCQKRQRPNDTGNDTNKMQRRNGTVFDTGSNRDELILSPETVGYLVNGVQYAKV